MGVGVFLDREHLTRPVHIGFADRGKRPVAARPVEERRAELLFQPEQLLVERGLGQVQLLRGGRDAALIRDGDHVFT